jgi:hypothetical protein
MVSVAGGSRSLAESPSVRRSVAGATEGFLQLDTICLLIKASRCALMGHKAGSDDGKPEKSEEIYGNLGANWEYSVIKSAS